MTTRWLTLERRRVFEIPNRITVELETVQLPDGRVVQDYAQVRMASFAVVYAETVDKKVICLRQYKHGPKRVSLTLPAGHLEAGERPMEGRCDVRRLPLHALVVGIMRKPYKVRV